MRWGRARAVRKCGNVRSVRLFFKPDAPVPQVAGRQSFRDRMPQRWERHGPCEQTRLSKRGNVRSVRLFFKPDAPVPQVARRRGFRDGMPQRRERHGPCEQTRLSKRGNVRPVRQFFKPDAPVLQMARKGLRGESGRGWLGAGNDADEMSKRGFGAARRGREWGRGRFPPGLPWEAPRLNSRLWRATTPSPSKGQAPKYIV